MTVVAVTTLRDAHARLTMVAAELGYDYPVVRWFGESFPVDSRVCFRIGRKPGELRVRQCEQDWGSDNIRTVWFRRPALPGLPGMEGGDSTILVREARALYSSIHPWLEGAALWVNPYTSRAVADSKLMQLAAASKLSLTIPETLVTNDIEEVRCFARQHRLDSLIFKTFTPARWRNSRGEMVLYSTLVPLDQLEDSICNAASIWQAPVPKAFEVRATIFGKTCLAVKIDSQLEASSRIDWRAGKPGEVPISPYALPEGVLSSCFSLMQELGLVFAAIDFIVTPDGDHVFLEANEAGQFLWVERQCPAVPMLDAFTQFCISGDKNFRYLHSSPRVTLNSICASDRYAQLYRSDMVMDSGVKNNGPANQGDDQGRAFMEIQSEK